MVDVTERCGFFNATNSSNPDRVYDSSDFAAYFASFIGNGVFAKHSDQLRVAQQSSPDMSVQVLGGQAWINGWWYENTSTLNIDIDPADGTLDRIDIIVVQFDLTNRVIKTIIRKGSPSAGATAPVLNRDDDLWELKLAEVNVPHGTVNITDGKITDTRSDTTVCGWVSGLINQMDTTELFNQLKEATQDAVDAMNEAIDGTIAGNLQTYRRSLRVETEIPAEADLNEYQTAGNYGCSVAGNVAGIKNKPSGLANQFLLFVHTVGSEVLQEVIDAVDGSRWCRAGAGVWVQTYDSSSIVPVANGGTGATTAEGAASTLGFVRTGPGITSAVLGQLQNLQQGIKLSVEGEMDRLFVAADSYAGVYADGSWLWKQNFGATGVLPVSAGGTGSTSANGARTNLGLGKTLWTGSFKSGSISVPGLSDYDIIGVYFSAGSTDSGGELLAIMSRSYDGTKFLGGMVSSSQTDVRLVSGQYNVSGNTLTYVQSCFMILGQSGVQQFQYMRGAYKIIGIA